MKKIRKVLVLVFVLLISVVLLSGCSAKNNEYVKVGVYLTEEGTELYAVGLSRSTLLSTSKGEVEKTQDWTKPSDDATLPDGYSFSNSYNEVKSYILFHNDVNEMINKLTQEKQPLDIAFIPFSALSGIDSDKKEKLCIVYVDTYIDEECTEVSGVWVSRKGYMTYNGKVNSYFKKVISSLVKANEFAYQNSNVTLDEARTYVETKLSELTNFEKFLYDVLGKSYSDGRTADIKDFTRNETKDYIAVLETSLKSSDIEVKTITKSSGTYYRKDLASYEDTDKAMLVDLLDDSGIDVDLDVMFNQIAVYKQATFNKDNLKVVD